MGKEDYKYIYGPVPSWRLGSSLGIDPVSQKEKICSFDCVYCQIGRTKFFSSERKVFIPVSGVIEEINSLPELHIDYITFSGSGEPTLAGNLGQMIEEIKKTRKERIAVITNSSLIDRKDVQRDLMSSDFVIAKLDAPSKDIFKAVNNPIETIEFDVVVEALKKFRKIYKGKLALQVMFISQNRHTACSIAEIAKEINPDEVQINTPLRPCGISPLSKGELDVIEGYFKGLNTISVYKAEHIKVEPVSKGDTLRRRGKITD